MHQLMAVTVNTFPFENRHYHTLDRALCDQGTYQKVLP
jgi:hypothetical protein